MTNQVAYRRSVPQVHLTNILIQSGLKNKSVISNTIRTKSTNFRNYPSLLLAVKLPTGFHTGGSLYVDPKSYSDMNDAINDFAYEVRVNYFTFYIDFPITSWKPNPKIPLVYIALSVASSFFLFSFFLPF